MQNAEIFFDAWNSIADLSWLYKKLQRKLVSERNTLLINEYKNKDMLSKRKAQYYISKLKPKFEWVSSLYSTDSKDSFSFDEKWVQYNLKIVSDDVVEIKKI